MSNYKNKCNYIYIVYKKKRKEKMNKQNYYKMIKTNLN